MCRQLECLVCVLLQDLICHIQSLSRYPGMLEIRILIESKVSKQYISGGGLSPPGKALLPPHTLPSLTRLASCLSSSPSRPHLLPLPGIQISFKLFRSKKEDFKVWIYIKNIDSRHSSASVCQFVEMKITTCSLFSSWGWLLWVLGCMKSIQLLSEP